MGFEVFKASRKFIRRSKWTKNEALVSIRKIMYFNFNFHILLTVAKSRQTQLHNVTKDPTLN